MNNFIVGLEIKQIAVCERCEPHHKLYYRMLPLLVIELTRSVNFLLTLCCCSQGSIPTLFPVL
jgi:hypothetical protein